ncbi:MAG: hypothetical protein A2143_00715 [Gallionellales bacterium RBG_16_57_15]|nr:MAG: hypothetical protein A2143_00715 [Gallionellales bacterium RBG_16_57_15]
MSDTKNKKKSKPKKKRIKAGNGKLTAAGRRKLFIEAYITNGGNATEAAKTAGYSEKTAYSQGGRLLKHAEIQQLLAQRQQQLAEKYELTTESIIAELSKLVHADIRLLFDANGALKPMKDWPDGVASAVGGVEVVEMAGGMNINGESGVSHVPMFTKKVKLWDKNSAIEKAMKHLGMFKEDNNQKGLLGDLPRGTVKAIMERLRGIPG